MFTHRCFSSRATVRTLALPDNVWLKHRLALIFLALFTLGLLLPLGSGAAATEEVLTTPDTQYVSRSEFVRAAVQVLGINVASKKGTDAIMETARSKGALRPFGSQVNLDQRITRGEAILVLMELIDPPVSDKHITYRDVSAGTPIEKAVKVAIDNQWMRADRRVFGVNRLLTGKEGRLVLQRLRSKPVQTDTVQDPTQRIRVEIVRKPQKTLPKSDLLQQVWQMLSESYLYTDKLKADEAGYKAIEGLVNSLDDPYTTFLRPINSQNFRTQIQGEVTGIGAQVELKDGGVVVVAPLKGSPAEKAGIQPGDKILAVDGVSLAGLSLDDAVMKIRGPKGSKVTLHIERNGNKLDIVVVRDVVRITEVVITMQSVAGGEIAIVKIHQFGRITETDLRKHMADVQSKSPLGLILDLRNNPGGLLNAADVVASNFLPQGTAVAQIVSPKKTTTEITAEAPTIAASVPLVVIVNKGSASASEIVAGALQDAGRAKVVGTTTFGKGTVQQIAQFPDGSALKMTIAEWKTPNGRTIDGVGVTPDIIVEEEQGGRDAPLLKALELLGVR